MANDLAHNWSLDPEVIFLNHGSFGACPIEVLEYQAELRALLEREPVHFFVREYYPRLDQARAELAAFLDADPDGLAFVHNATSGVNSVLRSLRFQPGDELLVTDHEYNACHNALEFVAERWGARVVVVEIPFPVQSADQIVAAILSEVSDLTRLALIDHITSSTALVFPIKEIVARLEEKGIDTLVDGAHAPGMLPLSMRDVGAAWYTGNCHKWLCAPKGSGFLYVREDKRGTTRPAVISHGANTPTAERPRFRHEFDWIGTIDPTAWLSVPVAIKTIGEMVPGGWPEVMSVNHLRAVEGRRVVCEALGVDEPTPPDLIGSLASIPLPDGEAGSASPLYVDPLGAQLWHEHKIEVPISPWPAPPKRVLRLSAQLYNSAEDYEVLAGRLKEICGGSMRGTATRPFS